MTTTAHGRFTSLLLDLATHEAEVTRVEEVGAGLRWVSIVGDGLRKAAWTPGDVVQVVVVGETLLGPWEIRSYTPLALDPATGTAEILWHVHGNGPGSDWAASAVGGAPCRVAGPRRGVRLPASRGALVFFGDETSFSTAVAVHRARDVRVVLEVESVEGARAVLDRFGLVDVVLVAREPGDAHLAEVERAVLAAHRVGPDAAPVLTGKASSVQRLHRALRGAGVQGRRISSVPYWAPGKKGLKGH
ncbi:siderophore-interacting protein [Actinosynnema mirum]|uniref:FAD-binding 9 siderophore-interacting domain protein n=1 Tax=Actinosynnema mirum (strain ATCC 29888 / DSM 43827 / JCM 3225 / NBRC 14064 / NCIMB 13271 / NRRL B-12336 / IMRU 3971 / 101) TaxID=446462 RepID=C6W820_ACTMD|nr:siderophore-interacting protein [Actinosynnema mirum]ACU37041.1 FAD-binding 9 siderophore-interacting domain protein [Actinosynnema mirum DSM 43827]